MPDQDARTPCPFETLGRFFAQELPPLLDAQRDCLPTGVSVVFLLRDGGAWRVERDESGEPRVHPWSGGPPLREDCVVECDGEDFLAILEGRLHPARAFLSGRVRVEGDIGLVLSLQACVLSEAA